MSAEPRETRFAQRVALATAAAASTAAMAAALATIVSASYLMRRAEDRRLTDAAVTFAAELDAAGEERDAVDAVHRDETIEMNHTGMLFAVYDAHGRILVGDSRIGLPASSGCAVARNETLRVCRVRTARNLHAVVGAAHASTLPLIVLASMASSLAAAALAWWVSRPLARVVVAPLTDLRRRIADREVLPTSSLDLGPPSGVAEVDALRRTLVDLVLRVEAALELANRFASNAAHELRTPLTAVRAEMELLVEGLGESGLRDDAVRAERTLAELASLVERLLVLSSPAGAEVGADEPVSIRDLLEDVVAALPDDARARVAVSESDAIVRGDAVLLTTMIANVLGNGLKFGTNVVTTVAEVDGEIRLVVSDDGPGLDASDRERAFEPFFRSREALRRRLPGHGLGLALVRHIARMHGGDARFLDSGDRGAVVEIRLRSGHARRP